MHESVESVKSEAVAPGDAPPPSHSGLAKWFVVLAAATLVIGPLLGAGLHHERARWRIAAGLEHYLDDDVATAIADLDAAAEIAPDLVQVYLLRSQWRTQAGDYAGALADAEEALKLSPGDAQGVQLKADALLHSGRSREAAKVWIDFAAVPPSQYEHVSRDVLNVVAYYRALGNEDLKAAWAEINVALARLNQLGEGAQSHPAWRAAQVAYLDTRGYIRLLRRDRQGALDDLNSAVLGAERQRHERRLGLNTAARLGVIDPRLVERQFKEVDRTVAVIRYHRGLALESLDRVEEAEKDFRRVRELGFEPGNQLF
jgi:tetratricopeptide (TPR) repeat protein